MKQIYLILIALITFNFGYTQTDLVAIDRDNIIGPTNTATVSNVYAVGFTRGSGISKPNGNSVDGFASQGFDQMSALTAFNNRDYVEWEASANPNYVVTINSIRLVINRKQNSPSNFTITYSTDNFVTRTTLPAKSITSKDNTTLIFNNFSVTAPINGNIKFRLLVWDQSSSQPEIGINALPQSNNTDLSGVTQPGLIMSGTITPNTTFDGLTFSGDTWSPQPPSTTTSTKNAYVLDGNYEVTSHVQVKNLTVNSGASVLVKPTGSITVNGNLITNNNFTLQSTSTSYPSLIVTGSVDGNATYIRHVNANSAGNDLISAPVTGENFNVFISKNPNVTSRSTHPNNKSFEYIFGTFNKTNDTYEIWTNTTTTTLLPGVGYRAGSISNQNNQSFFTFTGEVNTGIVPQTLSFGPSNSAFEKSNLIGNPYPSYIDAKMFIDQNLNQFDPNRIAVYGFDGDSSNGWIVWTKANAQHITPGQGFFVVGKSPGVVMTFTPAMASAASNDDFIQGRPANSNTAHTILQISNGSKTYTTGLYFNEESSKSNDMGYDAPVFGLNAPNFAIYSQLVENNSGLDLAVQSLSYDDLADVIIPIGINAKEGQQITINLRDAHIPQDTEVYLEDNVDNTYTLLNNSDYTFTTKSNLNGIGRFFLRFTSSTLENNDSNIDKGLQIYASSKIIFIKGLLNNTTTASVYDLQGRKIRTITLEGNTNNNQLDLSQVASGVYIIKLKNDTQEKTQKIILN
ncbi:T9SS type A sorting domain-containing protein [uncultured Gelidibacter sp.]|uniref:T9SS type A sorting domain-containing protein n=1 Tax=uncultured Gelidibacter sp. TaxID=259318 RepID=UPI00261A43A1|nr:T9SS type A sorting domain-containing protein [uncultured Gelidibacter sp.]